jgi:hypothetical protein
VCGGGKTSLTFSREAQNGTTGTDFPREEAESALEVCIKAIPIEQAYHLVHLFYPESLARWWI